MLDIIFPIDLRFLDPFGLHKLCAATKVPRLIEIGDKNLGLICFAEVNALRTDVSMIKT